MTLHIAYQPGFLGGASGKEPACQCPRQAGLNTGLVRSRSLGHEGHGNPLQCSCLEYPMDRGAWQVTAHRAAKSWTLRTHICTNRHCKDTFSTILPHKLNKSQTGYFRNNLRTRLNFIKNHSEAYKSKHVFLKIEN